MNDSESRVVIVTGGSRGIGRAIALKFAEEKAKIVILHYDVDENAADETLKLLSDKGVIAESHSRQQGSFELPGVPWSPKP